MKTLLLLLSGVILLCPELLSQTSGPAGPGSAVNTMCSFSYSSMVGYTPATNVMSSDNVYATASHCDCCDQNTQCLFATNFGFSIPLSATINGIVAEVEKRSGPNGQMQDNPVMILKNGTETGTSHSLPGNWGYTDQYYTYGSSTDLWGATWSPADINNSGFGLGFASISYTCFGNNQPLVSYIDHVRITIHYTDLSTGIHSSQSSDEIRAGADRDGFFVYLPAEGIIKLVITDLSGRQRMQQDISGKGYHPVFCEEHGMFLLQVIGTNGVAAFRVFR
ncbi:MAG: hypothetical protein IT233_03785 [Bacteroidia bacterium]|nr:hypothetical protein [Bacteroidia bacterium]